MLVSNSRSNNISRITPDNQVTTIPVGRDYQFGVAESISNGNRYVADLFHSRVEVTNPIHPNPLIVSVYDIAILAPFDIAYSPSTYDLYVANSVLTPSL